MSAQEIMKSRKFLIVAIAVGVIIVAFVSFACGVFVGFHKAKFSYKFGENYERNFIDSFRGMRPGPRGMMRNLDGRGFRNGHGIAGDIVSISGNSIIVKNRDGQENSVTVADKTIIKRGQDTISVSDLGSGDQIVVMGRPGENGTVDAHLIRVFSITR